MWRVVIYGYSRYIIGVGRFRILGGGGGGGGQGLEYWGGQGGAKFPVGT